MGQARRAIEKRRWKDDPLVDIHPEFLRATVDAIGWSIQRLAKEAGEESQTLDNLAKGTAMRRCRSTRRRRLAEALKVPESWLAGTSVAVPELSRFPREAALSLPPRVQIAAGALFRRAASALRRDLKTPEIDAEVRAASVGEDLLIDRLCWSLFELIRPAQWRVQLTTWRPVEPVPAPHFPQAPGMLENPIGTRSEADERAALGLVHALEAALAPWFTGESRLDYDRLRVLVGYDVAGERPGPPHPRYAGTACSPLRMLPQHALGVKP
jgi:lambda repressor-like predicted transcriptional regulator